MTILRVDTLSGIGTNGPVFDGDLEFNSQNYVILPKGTTDNRIGLTSTSGALRYNTDSSKVELYDGNQWTEVQSSRPDLNGGARGLFGGGYTGPGVSSLTIDYINISSTGNAQNFGNLIAYHTSAATVSSSTRGIWAGGYQAGVSDTNVIDYITISSTGNAQDFGDLLTVNRNFTGTSSSTRGVFIGGNVQTAPAYADTNVIQYITIASTGDAKDFGDIIGTLQTSTSCSSSTRGVFAGGYFNRVAPANPLTNLINYITISTLGNSQDFGDLTAPKCNLASCSNPIRGVFSGGRVPTLTNVIEYVTIATAGNSVRFGDLTVSKQDLNNAGASSPTRGTFAGGRAPGSSNVIDYITFSSQGNAVDFGDLTTPTVYKAGCSNAHGGL